MLVIQIWNMAQQLPYSLRHMATIQYWKTVENAAKN